MNYDNYFQVKEKSLPSLFVLLRLLQWGAFYLLIANFFATQNIGGTKELVVLL